MIFFVLYPVIVFVVLLLYIRHEQAKTRRRNERITQAYTQACQDYLGHQRRAYDELWKAAQNKAV